MPEGNLLDRWHLMRAIHADTALTGADKGVAFVLLEHFNVEEGVTWPSTNLTADWLGISERAVRYSLSRLRKGKYFFAKGNTKGGRGNSTRYVPNWEKGEQACTLTTERGNASSLKGANSRIKRGQSRSAPYKKNLLKNLLKNKPKESVKPPNENGFQDWYEAYPLHASQADALKAFRKALKKTDLATLIAGAEKYAASIDDPKYTKYPATWLNKECWLDEPPPRPKGGGGIGETWRNLAMR